MTDPARLTLFGGFELTSPDDEPIRVGARKARALLAWLSLQPGIPHSRDRLATLLWGDTTEQQARHSLRQTLSGLRKASPIISSALGSDKETVELCPDRIEVDALVIERRCGPASPPDYRELMSIYRGEFLEGMNARSPAYDEWLMERREHYRRLVCRTLESAMKRALSDGNPSEAVLVGARLVALEPLREDVHREMMRCYAALGRTPDALNQYRICRSTLARELNVSPSAETEKLKIRLLSERSRPAAPDSAVRTPMPAAVPRRTELRQLSVVRAEPVTPTGPPDPEEEARLIAALREACKLVAEAHDVAPPLEVGQGFLLLFGSPATSANDSLRALQAAADLGTRHPARLAVASGREVLYFDEQMAESGGIERISGGASRQAETLVAFADAASILITDPVRLACINHAHVEGPLDTPLPGGVPVWRLTSVDVAKPVRALPGYVGRRVELNQLGVMLDYCREAGHGHVFMIRGEAGIGKTRLARKIMDDASSRGDLCIEYLIGVSPPGREDNLARTCLVHLVGSGENAEESAADRLRQLGLDEPAIEFAFALLGIGDPGRCNDFFESTTSPERQSMNRRLLETLFTFVCRSRLVVLVIEDIHRATPALLRQLADLASLSAQHRLVLVATGRLESEPAAAWHLPPGAAAMTTLDLQPLPRSHCRQLAERLAGSDHPRLDDCIERSGGNPLFLEQLLLAADHGDTILPDTIQSIVESRLDMLAESEREAVCALAVLGWRFSAESASAIVNDDAACDGLMANGLVVIDSEEGRFLHELVQRGIYDSILPSRKRALHARAADWFKGRNVYQHARHAIAAGHQDADGICLDAASRLAGEYAFERALDLVSRRIEQGHRSRLLLEARARLLAACGDTARAADAWRESIDSYASAAALTGCADALIVLDRYDEATSCLDRFDRVAASEKAIELCAKAEILRSRIAFAKGNIDQCHAHGNAAVKYAKDADLAELEIESLSTMADAHYQQGDMRAALDAFEQCHQLARSAALLQHAAINLAMAGMVKFYCLKLDEGLADAREAFDMARRVGHRRHQAIASTIVAELLMTSGRYVEALEAAREGESISRSVGSTRFETESASAGAHLNHLLGDCQAGYEAALDAARRMVELRPAYSGPWLMAVAARCAPDAATANSLLEEGSGILDEFTCISHNYIHYYVHAIDRLLLDGNVSAASRQLERLESYLENRDIPFGEFCAQRAHTLIKCRMRSSGNDSMTDELRELEQRTRALSLRFYAETQLLIEGY